MSPPKQPPRPGSSPRLPIQDDLVAPGAVHVAPTSPPPAMPMPAPKELAGPRGKLGSLRDGDIARELAQRDLELAAAKRALEEAQRKPPAPQPQEPPPKEPSTTEWKAALFKLVVGLGAVLTALATILGVRTATTVEPKVDRTADKQAQQATKTTTVEERVLAIEKHFRAHEAWQRCMDAKRDSAIERGTGHKVDSDHGDVQWKQQAKPQAIPRTLWTSPPWLIDDNQSGCGAEPAPPTTPPPPPP